MAETASTMTSPDEDPTATNSRITRNGRKLSYELKVRQQPDRARACGQGAKSSSDRRPVDPPPIVQLRIFEGEEKRDITLTYNASLFVCATLESARAIAHPRASHASAGIPVLTGTPVAGISYLDRPNPAGYFVFTDLSVRHEGHYKLSFTLFEELKEEKDQDATAPQGERFDSQVYSRCAVSSRAFEVYSAKKFPGLTSSTILSRIVADQGCRVRIRREVRMRRRDSKPGEQEWDDAEEPSKIEELEEDTKQAVPSSPEVKAAKDNAALNNTENSQALHAAIHHHNTSQPQAYHPNSNYCLPVNEQHVPQYAYQQQPHYPQAYPHQYPPQSQYAPQHSYTPYQHQQQQQQQQYSPYGYSHNRNPNVPPPPYGYMQQQQQPQMHHHQQQHHQQLYEQQHQPQQMHMQQMRHDGKGYSGMSDESQSYPGQQQAQPHYQANVNQGYGHEQQQQQQQPAQQQQPMMQPNSGHQIHAPSKASETSASSPTYPHSSQVSPTLPSSSSMTGFPPAPMHYNQTRAQPPPPTFYTTPTAGYASKRSYGSTFNTLHLAQPLRSGARPSFGVDGQSDVPAGGAMGAEADQTGSDEDLQDLESIKLSYRRADGTWSMVVPRTF